MSSAGIAAQAGSQIQGIISPSRSRNRVVGSKERTGTAHDFIRLLTVKLHWKDKEKNGLPGLPIKGPVKTAK
jgi:hypothetical protein